MGHTVGGDGSGAWPALDALVSEVVEVRAQIAALQAAEARLLADAVDIVIERTAQSRRVRRASESDLPLREVAAELAAAMRLSDRTVQHRMGDAATLVSLFPATLDAWETGQIDHGHATAIVDAGSLLRDDDVRARFERQALDAAATETPGRLRPLLRAVAAQLDPAAAAERAKRSHADRRVRLLDLDDDLARVMLDLPATLAHAIFDRATEYARAVLRSGDEDDGIRERGAETAPATADADADGAERTVVITGPTEVGDATDDSAAPDGRTLDQLRADVCADLLLSGTPTAHGDPLAAIAAHVQVTVPVLTLAGVDEQPALLEGHGPIDAETARRLAAGAPGWDRILTQPYTGEPLAVDRYRPTAALARFLKARDEHCRFPGCRRPARRCDIDHTIDAAKGGPTRPDNNCHFCRRHHTLKHATAWTVRQRAGGVIEWTSPTGRTYRDRPPSIVRFVSTDWLTVTPAPDEPSPPF